MPSDRPETTPRPGQIWRNDVGAVRHVRAVDDDGYSVTYSRPAPAHPDWLTVRMTDWHLWAEGTNATCRRKAAAAEDKDWGYATA